jgi:hypothetical protein
MPLGGNTSEAIAYPNSSASTLSPADSTSSNLTLLSKSFREILCIFRGARPHWCQLKKSAVRNRTPVASPLALASPFGIRGDAARTSRQSRPTHWLVYTGKTLLRGFQNLNFALVCGGGLSLCSREFHSPWF